jgi:hypothetical protein
VIYDGYSKLDARLSTIIKDGQWMWRSVRSNMLVEIQSKLCLVSVGGQDTPQWTISKFGKFSCSNTQNPIHIKHNQAELWDFVWFSLFIPKQAFVTWLVMMDTLPTDRKLLS